MSGVLSTGRPLAVVAKVDVPAFGSYAFAEPVRVAVEVERVDRGIGISGTLEGIASGACDRCLVEMTREIRVDVDECFAANDDPEGGFAEANVLEGAQLDIADLARQLVDSSLPMQFLCVEDCPGLCPSCGRSRRGSPCACSNVER